MITKNTDFITENMKIFLDTSAAMHYEGLKSL